MWSPARWSDLPDVRGSNSYLCVITARGVGYRARQPWAARGAEGAPLYWDHPGSPGESAAGWPAPMFSSRVEAAKDDSGRVLSGWDLPILEIIRRGISTNRLPPLLHARRERRVPLSPLWGGFALNVAVWSAAAFGCIESSGRVRRFLRRRRARCERCGYDMTGLRETLAACCPECGTRAALQLRRGQSRCPGGVER